MLCTPLSVVPQQACPLSKEYIAGRWGSNSYILDDVSLDSIVPMKIYFFKDNLTFHRGDVTKGAVIFNITGRYSISGDTLKMYYQDYLNQTQATRKPQKTFFKIFYHDDNRMDIDIIEPKNQLPLILRRQVVE